MVTDYWVIIVDLSLLLSYRRYLNIMGDEPTGNLDSKNDENVFNILRELSHTQEMSMLIVTHDIDFANKTDRIIEMGDGLIM